MVCINNPHADDMLITRFMREKERVMTAKASLSAANWLDSERKRLAKSGIKTEIVSAPSGRIALRRSA